MRPTQIYIIDDDPIYQLITKKLIEKSNLPIESKSFEIAAEALTYFESTGELPDIILLDIQMPQMDAWEFLDELRRIEKHLHKEVTIYIVSSSIAHEDKMKAGSYDCVKGFLSKPMDLEKLKALAA